jgi:hypothetical protein
MDESKIEPSGGSATGSEAAQNSDTGQVAPQNKSRLNWEAYAPQPTTLTLQDLIDLPQQILPEATYRHLKNAGTEAWLALTTFLDGLGELADSARRGSSTGENKAPRRINVE